MKKINIMSPLSPNICHLLHVDFTELLNSLSLTSLGMLLILSESYDKSQDSLSDTIFIFFYLNHVVAVFLQY